MRDHKLLREHSEVDEETYEDGITSSSEQHGQHHYNVGEEQLKVILEGENQLWDSDGFQFQTHENSLQDHTRHFTEQREEQKPNSEADYPIKHASPLILCTCLMVEQTSSVNET